MCQSSITLIVNSLPTVTSDELLLQIKGRVGLFMLTMEVRLYLLFRSRSASDLVRDGGTLYHL